MAETIRAMKLAMKRRADDSDSDHEITQYTNRGNKLKRRAKFTQHGRLDQTGGRAYIKRVDHAGYSRNTIATNPPLLDVDGDLYSPSSSDNEHDRFAEPADDNPFGEVRLEALLRPLTAASELPNHPSLSTAYESKALTQMADDALTMLRRERANLWKAKRLLQRLRGDSDWMPCEAFETEQDDLLLNSDESVMGHSVEASINTELVPLALDPPEQITNGTLGATSGYELAKAFPRTNAADADAMEGVEAVDMAAGQHPPRDKDAEPTDGLEMQDEMSGDPDQSAHPTEDGAAPQAMNPAIADITEREAVSETASNSNGTNTHAMTTRARARSPAERSDRTPSPTPSDSASVSNVDPWFLAPTSCLIDRDLGLPANEAEDTRKLLLLYVQKQEQVVRSLDSLYTGLQKADRLRHYVYRCCKAEGHLVPDGKGNMVTEMSDGEDWYDVADWDLQPWELKDGKLEKGKDEVEDAEEEGRRRPGRGRRVNRM